MTLVQRNIMSSGVTNLSVQVEHSDGHTYILTKNFHGVTLHYVSDRDSEKIDKEVFIPQNSVSAIMHALNLISQDPEY